MNRILFAAARGARIQFYARLGDEYKWVTTSRIPLDMPDTYIIHPSDLHLQYGPVSTALREAAEYGTGVGGVFKIPYGSFWLPYGGASDLAEATSLERPLFLLILSEALCDDGI